MFSVPIVWGDKLFFRRQIMFLFFKWKRKNCNLVLMVTSLSPANFYYEFIWIFYHVINGQQLTHPIDYWKDSTVSEKHKKCVCCNSDLCHCKFQKLSRVTGFFQNIIVSSDPTDSYFAGYWVSNLRSFVNLIDFLIQT